MMTKLVKLQTEADIQKWIQWNMPDLIEAKFLNLAEPFMDNDEVLVILANYKAAKQNLDYRSIQNGVMGWNPIGTRWLAGITLKLLDVISRIR